MVKTPFALSERGGWPQEALPTSLKTYSLSSKELGWGLEPVTFFPERPASWTQGLLNSLVFCGF